MQLTFEAVAEAMPGPKWRALFQRYWPAYQAWYAARKGPHQPNSEQARAALGRAMPELLGTYDRLLELTDGSESAAQLLSCYRPPAYLISCSQAALSGPRTGVLVRNYDLDPELNEGLILNSAWTGRQVMASSEFLWGVADGMNDAGLALSLAFGGRRVVGDGFGIPLILRYVLEVCDDLGDALTVLRRVPSHMAYNVTLLDRKGDSATVQVAPDRAARVVRPAIATNHQEVVEWPEHGRFTATETREDCLRAHHHNPDTDATDLVQAFLRPPLYNTDYRNGFGTLYTAVYRPDEGKAQWRWPNGTWDQSLADFREGRRMIRYSSAGARMVGPVPSRTTTRPQWGDWVPSPQWPPATGEVAAVRQGLAAARAGLAAAGCKLSPALQAWFQEAEQSDRVPWESLGAACAQGVCGL